MAGTRSLSFEIGRFGSEVAHDRHPAASEVGPISPREGASTDVATTQVNSFSISVDGGYGAGPDQTLDQPLGVGGEDLPRVAGLPLRRRFQEMYPGSTGDTVARRGVDDDFAARGFENLGAWIMGRNMFGPVAGPWSDDGWKGWWGKNPPYHVPVFVLTHHARAPITMEGGTTFHFVTDGIHAALKRAKEAAQGKDVRLGGGVATIRQYLTAGLIDEIHLVISPVLLGRGRAPSRRHRHGEPRLQVHGARLRPRQPRGLDEMILRSRFRTRWWNDDRDDFLAWVKTTLYEAELALLAATPRRAGLWS